MAPPSATVCLNRPVARGSDPQGRCFERLEEPPSPLPLGQAGERAALVFFSLP